MKVVVVDYGMGNLRSVAKALEHVRPDATVTISSDAQAVRAADRVVFPGQGAMPDCMKALQQSGLGEAVREACANKPFLGLCVGMQMLFQHSEEGDTPGLGVFRGTVRRFDFGANPERLKVPHMGWNEVAQTRSHPVWAGISDDARFYHVHSYYCVPEAAALTCGETHYGLGFTSAVASDNIFAAQFHPEKSSHAGLTLFSNFLQWKP